MEQTIERKNIPLYYSNIVGIEASVFDILLNFGLKKDRSTTDIKKEDIDISIVMSPQHAKALLVALSENINKYEVTFGEIIIERKSEE